MVGFDGACDARIRFEGFQVARGERLAAAVLDNTLARGCGEGCDETVDKSTDELIAGHRINVL